MTKTKLENFFIPLGLFAAALTLRLIWAHQTHAPTLDTAVVGLMAMDIQEGARPLFFTGQGYMGALEAYFTAGMFSLFGADRFTMCLAPSLFGALWPVLLYFFLRLDVSAKAAAAGAMLVVFPAGYILWYTAVPYGGYPEMYVFGMVMLLHAALRLKQKTFFPWRDALTFSAFAFLGCWTNLQVFPFMATAGVVWLCLLFPHWKEPSRWLPFALVPVALALAVIPQILLSAENPSSPPLFSHISLAKIHYSFRALYKHDLLKLMGWQGLADWPRWICLPPYLLFAFTGLTVACRKSPDTRRINLLLCAIFVGFFSLLYFPHPMSGFVPRYLIAPFVLCTSVFISLSLSARNPVLKWVCGLVFTAWLMMQICAYPASVRVRHAKIMPKLETMHQLIEVAREAGLTHLRRVGSGMEGHKAAPLTFLSGKNPVFTSSYDERRRDADLAWHRSPQAGYFFPSSYLPFIVGSLQAMGIQYVDIRDAGYFQVLSMPKVPVDKLSAMRMFREPFTWKQEGNRIRIDFEKPSRITGLRLTAPAGASLPYQYTLTDENGKELSTSIQRLGTSYLSGDRVYFKGFEDQLDIYWPATQVTTLILDYTPGNLNRLPIKFEDLYLFTNGSSESQEIQTEALEAWLAQHPDAQVVASDAVAGLLYRAGVSTDRLPLPWNPRDPQAQPPEFDLQPGQPTLILMENRFAHGENRVNFGPIQGLLHESGGTWKRFTYHLAP